MVLQEAKIGKQRWNLVIIDGIYRLQIQIDNWSRIHIFAGMIQEYVGRYTAPFEIYIGSIHDKRVEFFTVIENLRIVCFFGHKNDCPYR